MKEFLGDATVAIMGTFGIVVLLAFLVWPIYSLMKQERDPLAALFGLAYVAIVGGTLALIELRLPIGAQLSTSRYLMALAEDGIWLLILAGLAGWITALCVVDRRRERQAFERSTLKRLDRIEGQLYQQELREKQELYGPSDDADVLG